MSQRTIPVGISNRHFHVSQADLERLFGPGSRLTKYRDISQKGQYAANEAITVVGPKGKIDNIRIVGPTRGRTQLEIAPSDAHRLGVSPPVRYSGDLNGSAGARLIGPKGEIELEEGIIIPQRHIHMSPADARIFGVRDRARVVVSPANAPAYQPQHESRHLVFDNVLIRVDPSFVLDFHIDTDEANAAGLQNGDQVQIVGLSVVNAETPRRRLVTENEVRRAILSKSKIKLGPNTMLTPAARDLGEEHGVFG